MNIISCDVCRKICHLGFYRFYCNDKSTVTLCAVCEASRSAIEKMMMDESGQMALTLPPDGVMAIAMICERGGISSMRNELTSPSWYRTMSR